MYEELKGKKLLILGGIDAMVEVTNRAHELGIIVYVTDYLENSPAKKVADKSFMVSATDVEAVVELCKKEQIDGIYTGNCDMLLPYYAQICQELQLPCYGRLEHFTLMTDKKGFKEVCRKYDVPVVPEYTEDDIRNNRITFPVIVKPVDSSGSRGITVCHTPLELQRGIEFALSFSASKKYIVERYMMGDEVVLYYYFQDKKPIFIAMCDRYVYKQNDTLAQLPTAYFFPSKHTQTHLAYSNDKIINMFRQIGMENGPIFLQAFIENGVPYLYEPGYRTNGAREQYIINETCSISSVDMLLNFALTGKESQFDLSLNADPFLHGKVACKLSPLLRRGKIERIEGLDCVKNVSGLIAVVPNNKEEDVIGDKEMGTLKQVAYRAFIVADTVLELNRVIKIIEQKIDYLDENGNSMIIAGASKNS